MIVVFFLKKNCIPVYIAVIVTMLYYVIVAVAGQVSSLAIQLIQETMDTEIF